MDKQRILNSTDLGVHGDSLYHPHNEGINNNLIGTPGHEEISEASVTLVPGFNKYGPLRSIVSPYFDTGGMEVFSATERAFPKWNDCMHIKSAYVHYPFGIWHPSRYAPLTGSVWKPYFRITDTPSGAKPWDEKHSSLGDWESASRRAWWSMQPRFEGDVQMLNYLFELKDFKDIAKTLAKSAYSPTSIAVKMRAHQSKLRKISKKLTKKSRTLGSYCNTIVDQGMTTGKILAQLHLLNEFAIKPFISDTATIIAQAGTIVKEAQAEFYKRGQEDQVSHYSESSCDDSTYRIRLNDFYVAVGAYTKHTFTASMEYSYNYMLRSQTDAFLKYWGLKLTPEVIWEGVPFSFLADYFYKIGDAIHYMSTDPNVKLMHTQYCESVLTTYASGYIASGDPNTNLLINGVKPNNAGNAIKGYTGSFYQRRLKSPNKGMATPRFTLPSGKQGANMAALAMCFIK